MEHIGGGGGSTIQIFETTADSLTESVGIPIKGTHLMVLIGMFVIWIFLRPSGREGTSDRPSDKDEDKDDQEEYEARRFKDDKEIKFDDIKDKFKQSTKESTGIDKQKVLMIIAGLAIIGIIASLIIK